MNPLFSILIPTYNRSAMLQRAIQSVLDQSVGDWELIIVDDGSTDNTKKVVRAFTDQRIVYHYQENQERSAARNKALSLVKGKNICFLDDDDYFLSHHLQSLEENLNQLGNLEILKTGVYLNDQNTKEPLMSEHPYSGESYLWKHGISLFQLCFPADIKNFSFDERLSFGEDLQFVLQCFAKGYSLKEINNYTAVICNHEERSSFANSLEAIIQRYQNMNSILDWADSENLNKVLISERRKREKNRIRKDLFKGGHWKTLLKHF